MRSKAHFRGHPIHPALVHFPLAFLIGAFCFDLLGRLQTNPTLWSVGAYLAAAGIATALLAALPGFLDYFFTVPPKSSGKRRATLHMLANLAAVALFTLAWALRGQVATAPGLAVLLAEGLGSGLLLYAGFQGGVLVSRNQIGVDHRYAKAGKWSEARPQAVAGEEGIVVASVGELQIDQMKLLHVEGRRIVLARTEEGYTAFDDHCTHRGGSLADGVVISGTVQCPWHGSQFDVRTGAVCNGPAKQPIGTYEVEVSGKRVVLRLEGARKPGTQKSASQLTRSTG
jgi:nitrite reductase/ring-hydroxylating ferredoxin subunit/uncharacterized membrane protein